jgi:hypothetical protein
MVLVLKTQLTVSGLTGRQVTDFLLTCDDDRYQEWWPGTHLQLHLLEPGGREDHVGDVVLMDELIGSRRVRMAVEVREVQPGRKVVWQMRFRSRRLPVRLTLTMRAAAGGTELRHAITAGWSGPGRLLDPVWRLYFTRSFARGMDRHARTEFVLLRDLFDRAAVEHRGEGGRP